jgi:mannan endo-1,4-beta-mannosidase
VGAKSLRGTGGDHQPERALQTVASSFGGASSYYLHTFQTADQIQVLDAMQQAGMKTVRIFISSTYANEKGSNNVAIGDVENNTVGVWTDAVLDRIDALMLRVQQRGMKLIIALHDRYSLGCWRRDAYVSKYNIPVASNCGVNSAQNDASAFYRNSAAAADMDCRFAHIVQHTNPNFGNRPWSAIPEAILGFDISNEAQAHLPNNVVANPESATVQNS